MATIRHTLKIGDKPEVRVHHMTNMGITYVYVEFEDQPEDFIRLTNKERKALRKALKRPR